MGKVLLCVFGSFLCDALARSRSRWPVWARNQHSLRCHGHAAGLGAGRWGEAGAGRSRQHISEAWSILPRFESVVLRLRLACFHDFAEAARSEHFSSRTLP